MSFGDPNNPYGQQPQQPPQGQPGYGYPQQQPQAGYGYPQQQQPGYGGYPAAAPMKMPGLMTAARVLLFIFGGLQIIVGIVLAIGIAAAKSAVDTYGGSAEAGTMLAGFGFVVVFLLLAFAAWAIILGVKFGKGGNGVRITAIVYASLLIVLSLANFVSDQPNAAIGGIIGLAIGGIVLASMVNSSASAWFNRPRF
ncbi:MULTISPECIES: hypothetical protein [Streptomyces]|uniref:Integral membrane protein n=1 Tax=Streptomyces sudanensis TaxID=436397 RepID=A0ABY4T8N7_9ACTN|nr:MULTISPECIES: hypothetical protein [Streptomyces]MCP9957647.1 hypothetical protein [Streptomyces sudanensis]MCP9986766.1 hypothetical protein [Streptomyces sudanensis]MCQ0001811.1 hypothetical protein [Streptomyces sudanensis]URN15333.1 hypothetical protein MW084_04555 [Streptomyces sudanensis]